MTEQEKFEAYAKTQGYLVEKDEQGLYRSVATFCHHGTWQAAIASREPKMRKATRDEKIVNPGVYEVPANDMG